jgi:hypothetical protein
MKKFYWQFLLLFACCTTTVTKDSNRSPEERLAKWDSGIQYRVDTLPLDPDSEQAYDGGMEITFYSVNGKLMKIKENVGLSWGNIVSTFYCQGDTLMGFSEAQEQFQIHGDSVDFSHLVNNYKGILIFQADTVTAESHTGNQMVARDTQNYGEQILEEFKDHLLQFKRFR